MEIVLLSFLIRKSDAGTKHLVVFGVPANRRQRADFCLITIGGAAWTCHKSRLSGTHTYKIQYIFIFGFPSSACVLLSLVFCGPCSRRNEIINQMPPRHSKNATAHKEPRRLH